MNKLNYLDNKVQYCYIDNFIKNGITSDWNRKPVGVVAMKYEDDEHEYLRISLSACSHLDQFIKAEGLKKAYGKLHSDSKSRVISVYDFKEKISDGTEPALADLLHNTLGLINLDKNEQFRDAIMENMEYNTKKLTSALAALEERTLIALSHEKET